MERKTDLRMSSRLLILLCLMFVGMLVATVIMKILQDKGLLTLMTIQDIFTFIVPAVAAMALFYRKPLHAMGLDRAPSWLAIALVAVFYVVSLPAMNWLVAANQAMTLPSWMSGLEQAMRASEDILAETTRQLLDVHSVWQLLSCVLVVGVMAGLSEEMLFRGAMLRTIQDSRMGTHGAVWTVAIIFSAIHLQFYGFVPRMVLGLWLGYLLVWTRSLWVPIIAHTLNNGNVVLFNYLSNTGVLPEGYGDNLGVPADGALPWLAIASLIVSLILAIVAHRYFSSSPQDTPDN